MTVLVGVNHEPENLDATIAYLSGQDLQGKRVLVESLGYPCVPTLDYDGKVRTNPLPSSFWNPVLELLDGRGATVLHGEDRELLVHSLRRIRTLEKKRRRRIYRGSEFYYAYDAVATKERTPHFLQGIVDRDPDYAVLGAAHVSNLRKILPACTAVFIPEDAERQHWIWSKRKDRWSTFDAYLESGPSFTRRTPA